MKYIFINLARVRLIVIWNHWVEFERFRFILSFDAAACCLLSITIAGRWGCQSYYVLCLPRFILFTTLYIHIHIHFISLKYIVVLIITIYNILLTKTKTQKQTSSIIPFEYNSHIPAIYHICANLLQTFTIWMICSRYEYKSLPIHITAILPASQYSFFEHHQFNRYLFKTVT